MSMWFLLPFVLLCGAILSFLLGFDVLPPQAGRYLFFAFLIGALVTFVAITMFVTPSDSIKGR